MHNVGRVDSAIRIVAGLAFFGVAVAVGARPFLAIAATFVGLMVLGTGVTRFCPLYTLLDVNTEPESGDL